jgi:hypothetical protein
MSRDKVLDVRKRLLARQAARRGEGGGGRETGGRNSGFNGDDDRRMDGTEAAGGLDTRNEKMDESGVDWVGI